MQIIPILALRLVQVFIRMICQKPEISVPSTLLPLLKTRQLWVKHWSYWGQYLVNKYWILLLSSSSSSTLCPKCDPPVPELTAHCASMRESRRPARGGRGELCKIFLTTFFCRDWGLKHIILHFLQFISILNSIILNSIMFLIF